MASIEQNRKAGYEAVAKGQLVPANLPSDPKPIPVAAYPAAPNPYLRTPLPESYVQQPDSQRQWQSGAVPQVRIPPAAKISNPQTGAQAASQTIVVVQTGAGGGSGSATGGGGSSGGSGTGTGSSITLETNNTKNNSQSVLNLIQGQNVTLSADAQGGVTITGVATGTVTNTSGNLIANELIIGNGGVDEKVLGTLGTSTTVLHGNAGGLPSFGPVDLSADVTNNLPVTNLNSGSGATNTTFWRGDGVWSAATGTGGGTVTNTSGNLTANELIIGNGGSDVKELGTLGTTTTVLHGNAGGPPSFGAVDLSAEVTNNLPVTNLNGGANASSSTFWRGDGTWSAPQAVQFVQTSNIATRTVFNTDTFISSVFVAFPSSGGPFRVMISYSLYLDFTGIPNQASVDFWVNDGTHIMAGVQTGQSNAASGAKTSASYGGFSTVSYANGAVATFTLFGIQSGAGGATVQGSPFAGSGPGSTFQISVLTSAV